MRTIRPGFAILAAVLTLTALSASGQNAMGGTGAATAVIQPLPEKAPADFTEAATNFRRDVGLRSDRSFALAVASNALANSTEYGFPLLPDEVAYLGRRDAVRSQLGPLQDYLAKFPDTFGGVYLDGQAPRSNGVDLAVAVSFTSDAGAHRTEIQRLLPAGAVLVLRTVKYSIAELQAIVAQVNEDRAWHKAIGIDVYLAGVDELRDRVLLGISSQNEAAASALAERYGLDRVYVFVSAKPELDACIRTNCPPP
jgi:hypothetical protein